MCLSAVTSLDHGFWLSVLYKRHFEEVINGSSRIKAALHILFRVHCACYVDGGHTRVFYYLSVYWSHQSQYHSIQRAYLIFIHCLQVNRAPWFWPVWYSQQGDMAVSSWCSGSGSEDSAVQRLTRRQSEVPAGGSHQWTVQTSQRCEAPRSGHCGGTCE